MSHIESKLEKLLGKERFVNFKKVRFKDALNYFRGGKEVGGFDLKIHNAFMNRQYSTKKRESLGNKTYRFYREFEEAKVYDAAIDAFALNTYSYCLAFIFEKRVAEMPWEQHLFTRAAALFTNTGTAKIYERIREGLFKRAGIDDKTPVKKYFADTALFIGLQMPLHWVNMSIGTLLQKGTIEFKDLKIMAVASFSMIPVAAFFGGPYGLYRDAIRKSAGRPLEYVKEN